MNMALTSEQIAEAYEILTRMKDMLAEAKELEKKGRKEESQAVYDEMVELTNAYYSLIPSKDFSYSSG
jgi:hypothetical protein